MGYQCRFCGKGFDIGWRVMIETERVLITLYACTMCKEGGKANEKVIFNFITGVDVKGANRDLAHAH
jgi:hypothetical protein